MAPRTLAGLVLAASITMACDDLTQKKPQTVSTIGAPIPVLSTSARGAAAGNVLAPVEASSIFDPKASTGERSVRLFGRGVSRNRQIRV